MQEVPRADASALVKLINSTTLLNKQLSAICQLNGLTSSGVKAHLQARITNRKSARCFLPSFFPLLPLLPPGPSLTLDRLALFPGRLYPQPFFFLFLCDATGHEKIAPAILAHGVRFVVA